MKMLFVFCATACILGGSSTLSADWMNGVGDILKGAQDAMKGISNRPQQKARQTITRPQPQLQQYQIDQSIRLTDKQSITDTQRMLRDLGYNLRVVDGVFGKKTATAIRSYQRSKGMRQDGYVSLKLLNSLTEDTRGQKSAVTGVSQSQELAEAQSKDRSNATIAGTAIGAGAGVLLSDKMNVSKGEGAAIGAALGAATGYVVGNETAKKRGDYASRYDEIDIAIEKTDTRIVELNSSISRIEANIQLRKQRIVSLRRQAREGKSIVSQAKSQLDSLEEEIKRKNDLVKETRVAIKVVEDDLETINSELAQGLDTELQKRRDRLVQRRNDLIASLNAINDINDQLEDQKSALSNLSLG